MRALFLCAGFRHSGGMSAAAQLRARTQLLHDRVDAAYGGFRLGDPASYSRFLSAHARALPAVEGVLAADRTLPPWRPRAALLAADLADLGEPLPLSSSFAVAGAAAWGALYVSEGSRLGGAMLARQVGNGLPCRYLRAAHLQGEWRALRDAIDAAGTAGGAGWVDEAAAGAAACFALYERAAALETRRVSSPS